MTASNNANQTRRGRPFEPGNRAGRGRKAVSRNSASIVLDKMAEGEAKEIAEKMFEAAKAGDIRAAELVLARVWPARKGRPVSLSLPVIETVQDVVKALGLVANAVGAGNLTPEEGRLGGGRPGDQAQGDRDQRARKENRRPGEGAKHMTAGLRHRVACLEERTAPTFTLRDAVDRPPPENRAQWLARQAGNPTPGLLNSNGATFSQWVARRNEELKQ